MAFVDAGWQGTPVAISAALAAIGFSVTTDGTVTIANPTLATGITVTGYRVLDNTAYVLVRSTLSLTLANGISATGPDHSMVISGTFMGGSTMKAAMTGTYAVQKVATSP